MCDGLFFTIPYTGTWGVVIGKATGAGAFAEQKRVIQQTVLWLHSVLILA